MQGGGQTREQTAADSPPASATSDRGAEFRRGGLMMGHEAGHESEGASGVLLLELSVKSETAQWSSQGVYSVFDLCVGRFITQIHCNTNTHSSLS